MTTTPAGMKTEALAASLEALAAADPAWLADLRREAWSRYEALPLPSRVEHLWRYTDPARLLPGERGLGTPDPHFGELPGDFHDGTYEHAAAYVLCRDGVLLSSAIDPMIARFGLVVGD